MDINAAVAAGAENPLLLFAMALVLGALHGLEPGHSKTMMAAYIIAIRGTAFQALLLGLSAAASHVVIVWLLAILGLRYGNELIGDDLEPVLMAVSGVIIVGVGLWVLRQALGERGGRRHDLSHEPVHRHHAVAAGVSAHHAAPHRHDHFHAHAHGGSTGHRHPRDIAQADAHTMAHARQIEARVQDGRTSTLQTILLGLSGGLIPCPAAITVLLLCLQLKKMALGLTLVAAFSVGLAVTLVAVGVTAAVGVRYAAHRTPWLDRLLQKAPFASALLICLLGIVMIVSAIGHGHP
uniref:nickel/cobalt efflux transporter n=1 Tax=Stappia sp. TaxID=1870903 RepID=UPI003BA9B379